MNRREEGRWQTTAENLDRATQDGTTAYTPPPIGDEPSRIDEGTVPGGAPGACRDLPLREGREGEALYRIGDAADVGYRLESGLVKLCFDLPNGRERIWGLAGPGDWIGALDDEGGRHAERAVILSRRVAYRAIVPPFGGPWGLAAQQAAAWRSDRLLEALQATDLPSIVRLARTLASLARRFGQPVEDEQVRVTLPLTHETLAGLTGCARETTTTLMSELKRAGAVRGTRGRYVVHSSRLHAFEHGDGPERSR